MKVCMTIEDVARSSFTLAILSAAIAVSAFSGRRRLCGCRGMYPSALPVMPITRCLEV
jgi:hypothetical protein